MVTAMESSVSVRSALARVIDEGDASGTQVVDQLRCPVGSGDSHDACSRSCLALVGVQDGQGGRVGQGLVFPDVGVLGPGAVGAGGPGVTVTAPGGPPGGRPRRF